MHEEFAALHAETAADLADLGRQWARGDLSAGAFAEAMDTLLMEAHTLAAWIGRAHAGDDTPVEADDRRFAAGVVESEHRFLRPFIQDLESGRYQAEDGSRKSEEVARRAGLYAGRLTGTANEAWGLTLPKETQIWWRLVGEEGSCSDCPELADASPFLAASMVTWPGSNDTACLQQCRCFTETEDGRRGFSLPARADA